MVSNANAFIGVQSGAYNHSFPGADIACGQWLDNDDWAARRWTSVEAIRVSGDAAIIAHYIGAIYRGMREGPGSISIP
ncbi:hypothetical protein A0H81_05522 [Grifola frondosa]|uniref:Uncharacterized protein n=1 Tax=Grifola frondosa TaxID=5627 RepID=A0A1C7MDA9_GRIFR|nr:hypothetical protein A0H81_05522 [Grifola frondosa]